MQEKAIIQEFPDQTIKGIVLVAVGISIFSLQDVIIRLLSGDYSVLQIMFIRALVALGPMALFVYWEGGFGTLRTPTFNMQFLRGILQMLSYTSYYMGLAYLPIADSTAIFFIAPLVVTVFSIMFLGEKVGMRRLSAVLLGFCGVLIIVRPGSGTFGIAALLPMIAAVTYSASIIITRRLGRTNTGASMALYSMLTFLAVSSLAGGVFGDGRFATDIHPSIDFLLRPWMMPASRDFMLLVLCGLIAACGFYCLAQGYRVAQASIVAPFEYVAMPLAAMWGFLVWNELPQMTTIMGILLIVGSGLYVLHRETVKGRSLVTGRGRSRIRL